MIGISQERANVFRAPAKRGRVPDQYAAGRGSAFVKFVYFYIYDADRGPSFIRLAPTVLSILEHTRLEKGEHVRETAPEHSTRVAAMAG